MIAQREMNHLKVMKDRWTKAEELVALEKRFRQIAITRGTGQKVVNLQLKLATLEVVLKEIEEGNKKVTTWSEEIAKYFGISLAGESLPAMKFYFPGDRLNSTKGIH